MTLPYIPRLFALGLASYFLIHLALGLMVASVARPAILLGERIRPGRAARLMLALRLVPAAGAASIVALVCLPSYLWLEPDAPKEHVGVTCLAAAVAGALMWGFSLARGLRAAIDSHRTLRRCPPLMALGGLFRPQLIVSRAVARALAPEQMAAALDHERAHWAAHDNLKRLSIALAPGILPFAASSRTLERGWSRFAEWAADDCAVAGSPQRSLALAEALVRVARLSACASQPFLAHLVGDPGELAARVERLLCPVQPIGRETRWPSLMVLSITLLIAAILAAILQPVTFYSVHRLLEHLVE